MYSNEEIASVFVEESYFNTDFITTLNASLPEGFELFDAIIVRDDKVKQSLMGSYWGSEYLFEDFENADEVSAFIARLGSRDNIRISQIGCSLTMLVQAREGFESNIIRLCSSVSETENVSVKRKITRTKTLARSDEGPVSYKELFSIKL